MIATTRLRTIFLGVIALILTGAALHALSAVFVPVVLAFFVALIAAPLDRGVRARVPPALGWLGQVAAVLAVLAVLAIFAAGIGLAAMQATRAFDSLPEGVITAVQQAASGQDSTAAAASAKEALEQTAVARDQSLGQTTTVFGIPLPQIAGLIGGQAVGMMASVAKLVAASTGTLITGVILVVLLMALMLAERGRWQRLLIGRLTASTEEEVEGAFSQIAHKLRVFLITRGALGLVTAVFYGSWLWWFDVDLLLVWMLLAVLLNFIPTVGSIIAGSLPVLYAMVTRDPGTVAIIALGLFALEQILGNVIDPYVQGKQVSVSPVVVLIGLLLWGWIWGITGTLLATPMTIVMLVICAHIPATRTFALMLSDKGDIDDLLVSTGVSAR